MNEEKSAPRRRRGGRRPRRPPAPRRPGRAAAPFSRRSPVSSFQKKSPRLLPLRARPRRSPRSGSRGARGASRDPLPPRPVARGRFCRATSSRWRAATSAACSSRPANRSRSSRGAAGIEELARLGLAVEDEEARGGLLERPERRGRAVHEEAALARRSRRRDLAAHDDLERALSRPRGGRPRRGSARTSASSQSNAPSTTRRSAPARTSAGSARPPARRSSASTTRDLPGARLPRQDRQPLAERDLDVLEDGEVADAEGRQHALAGAARAARSGGPVPHPAQRRGPRRRRSRPPGSRRTRGRSSRSPRCRGAPTGSSGRRTP